MTEYIMKEMNIRDTIDRQIGIKHIMGEEMIIAISNLNLKDYDIIISINVDIMSFIREMMMMDTITTVEIIDLVN